MTHFNVISFIIGIPLFLSYHVIVFLVRRNINLNWDAERKGEWAERLAFRVLRSHNAKSHRSHTVGFIIFEISDAVRELTQNFIDVTAEVKCHVASGPLKYPYLERPAAGVSRRRYKYTDHWILGRILARQMLCLDFKLMQRV